MALKTVRGAAALLLLSCGAYAAPSSISYQDSSQLQSCGALVKANLGNSVFFPNSTEFTETIASYYSADVQDVKPWCIFKPTTTEQVAEGIKILNEGEGKTWYVAIRSGGQSPFPSSNNIADGVTIDLSKLDSISYSDGIASIGTGATWGNVYTTLEAQGVMVGGGRAGRVGVGGFLLGGGFTWYSAEKGLAADNVVSYEVVLADGSIVEATADINTDMFKALKGGMNNVGVVTKFEINTFASRDVFGGITVYSMESKDGVIDSLVKMVDGADTRPQDTGFISISWNPSTGSTVALITANMNGETSSPTFENLTNYSPIVDLRSTLPLTGLVSSLASAGGLYNIWYTLTFSNTVDMAQKFVSVFESVTTEISSLIDEVITIIFLMTPLPKVYAKGNNILGLEETLTQNSLVMQVEGLLPSTKYRDLINTKLRAAKDEVEAYARETGQLQPWLYINYANPEQDALSSYGKTNVDFLGQVAKKYDPDGFFQTRVSGGFKVTNVI